MRLMHLTIPVAALLFAACSAGAGPSAPAATPALATRVEVQLTDSFGIELSSHAVPSGVPVTFVVTNVGAIEHEFYLGDEAAQGEHEMEMVQMGGMSHDEPDGIALKPGETKELTHTFAAAGTSVAGCHVAGHYAAGMRAEISVGG